MISGGCQCCWSGGSVGSGGARRRAGPEQVSAGKRRPLWCSLLQYFEAKPRRSRAAVQLAAFLLARLLKPVEALRELEPAGRPSSWGSLLHQCLACQGSRGARRSSGSITRRAVDPQCSIDTTKAGCPIVWDPHVRCAVFCFAPFKP